MIRKILSVRSRGTTPYCSRHRGFSLVEIMMSLVLVAIGLALALPSYRDMVEKRQVTNGAEQLASFINTAQGVAMKTNQVVTVSYSRTADDEWCVGATEGTDPCDCTGADSSAVCEIASQPFILNNGHAADRDLVLAMGASDSGSYSFDPVRGFAPDLDGNLTMELRSPSDDFRLNLVVNSTGRVVLCSGDSARSIPGYGACPVAEEPES
jgi:type IV fimbrial biogenesis protein FimT